MRTIDVARSAPLERPARLAGPAGYAVLVFAALGARQLLLITVDYRHAATLWLPYVGAAVLFIVAVGAIWTTKFHRLWRVWEPEPERRAWIVMAEVVLATILLVEGFVAGSYVLTQAGVITIGSPDPSLETIVRDAVADATMNTNATSGFSSGSTWTYPPDEFKALEALYIWHVADGVPGLNIPERLDWQVSSELNFVGRALLLTFTVLVILPVAGLIVEVWKRTRERRHRRLTERREVSSC
jgi:hypothetical protein